MAGRHRAEKSAQELLRAEARGAKRELRRVRREARELGVELEPARTIETSEKVAGIKRQLIAFGDQIGEDPAALAHFRELEDTLRDNVNRGIFLANRGEHHYSKYEMARILGITPRAILKRITNGEQVHLDIEIARAGGAVVRIGDERAVRAASLAAAQLEDRTGSERERQAFHLRAVGE